MSLSDDKTTRSDFEPGELGAPSPHRPPVGPQPPRMHRAGSDEVRALTSFANAELRAAEVCNHIAGCLRALATSSPVDAGAPMERAASHCTVQALAALRRAEELIALPAPDMEPSR